MVHAAAPCSSLFVRVHAAHRNTDLHTYMVAFFFKAQKAADEFYLHFNGRQFNSMEPECVCVHACVRASVCVCVGGGVSSREGWPVLSKMRGTFTQLITCLS